MATPGRLFFSRRQRRLMVPIIILFSIVVSLSPTLQYYVFSVFEYPLHYKEYKNFDIRIPGGYTVHGIDVSKWQSRVDWKRVKAMKVDDVRFSFVFIKATEGSWRSDAQFGGNWQNAKKAGLIRGAYHFFLPHISPKAQAINFIRSVQLSSGDLPPVVDIEEEYGMSGEQIRKNTKIFLDALESHYGVKPILYTNRDFYKRIFADEPEFKPFILWIAHYHVSELTMPDDSKWHFWQHSDAGHVNGINEKVDFNVFNGSKKQLEQLTID